MVVIVNPNKVGDPVGARAKLTSFVKNMGEPAPEWIQTTAADSGARQTKQAIADGARLVLAWGGDGTVIGVAGALAGTATPLGILPGGTGNLLARNLDIPLHLKAALDTAYQGQDRAIDLLDVYLGKGQHQVSAVMCGIGWDAVMVGAPEQLKKRLGWGAYVVQGARRIREKPMRVRLSIDGGPEQHVHGRTVLIANVGRLIGGVRLLPESEPDDGQLEVLIIDPSSPLDWLRTASAIARGRGSCEDPSQTLLSGREVVVSTGHRHPREIDGDVVSDGYGFRVRLMPAALTVRVPFAR